MTARKRKAPRLLPKAATGIQGFDDLSRGGLPHNRTSRVMGGPGTGKTVFALQVLVNGAQDRKQPPGKRRAARISAKSRTNGDQGPQRGP